ncbi:MAG: VirB4 family type IV secretion system protein [Candidatus Dormibacteria bacterium]
MRSLATGGGQPRTRRIQAPDILDLVDSERRKRAAELETWLEQLQLPVAFLICSRRETTDDPLAGLAPGRASSRLQAAMEDYLADQTRRRPRFRRTVFLALSDLGSDGEMAPSGPGWIVSPDRPAPLAEGLWRERPTLLRVGGRYLSSVWIERLPGIEVAPGWLWALVGTPGEFDLILSIWPQAKGAADRSLRRRMVGLRARELAAGQRGEDGDPRLRAALDSAARLREVLARSEGKLFDLAITATLGADTANHTRELVHDLQSRVAALRAGLAPAWCSPGPARLQTQLLPTDPLGPRRVVQSGELATLWPWLDDWDGKTMGAVHLGRHLRTGAPVWLKLHDPTALPNANLGVVAASGSGKSYLGGLLGLEAVCLGVRTVVLDPENEHRRWCEAVDGQYLSLGDSRPSGFNLLEMAEPGEAPSAVAELISLLCGRLSPAEIGQVSDAVRWVLAEAGTGSAVLSDCLPRLRRTEAGETVAHRLLPWLDGTAGALFNSAGRGPEVMTTTAVGLRELPSAWLPAATLLVSHWLWRWIRFQGGRKQAIVDEAGLLADNAPLQRLMAHLARRIRKYQGSLVLLTQSAGDLLGSAPGEVMAVNSATMLLGSQHPAAALRLQQGFLLDDAQRQWLERAGRGQFLLLLGSRRAPIQIEAASEYHQLLSSESDD